MAERKLDYTELGKQFTFGQPNRLSILVHPGWDKSGRELLQFWKRHLEEIVEDPNFALLVVPGFAMIVGNDTEQIEYIEQIKEWMSELDSAFGGRFALYYHSLLCDKDGLKWLKEKLGNPPQIIGKSDVDRYDFFTVSFDGVHRDVCVNTQLVRFPGRSVYAPTYWYSA